MECAAVREVISARLDNETSPVEAAALDAHLSACVGCQRYFRRVEQLHRTLRIRPAEPVPDLSDLILARAHPPAPGRAEWVRWALVVVAATELVLALPALVLGADVGAPVHVARHLGSLSVALALGMLYAAWRPERAYGLLPVALALAGCTAFTTVLDVAKGNVGVLAEAHHVLELVALVLLWKLAGQARVRLRVRAHRTSIAS